MNNIKEVDPYILVSIINTKLRNSGNDLPSLCDDLDIDINEILSKLKAINYSYDYQNRRFYEDNKKI